MKNKNDKVTIREVYDLLHDFREEVRETYVTRNEFMPVKSIVYGMVGLALAGIFTALLASVVKAFI